MSYDSLLLNSFLLNYFFTITIIDNAHKTINTYSKLELSLSLFASVFTLVVSLLPSIVSGRVADFTAMLPAESSDMLMSMRSVVFTLKSLSAKTPLTGDMIFAFTSPESTGKTTGLKTTLVVSSRQAS